MLWSTATSFVPSEDDAIENQAPLLARGVQPRGPVTCWPALSATLHPPGPRPATLTTSPRTGDAGNVIVTCAALFAR